MTAPLPFAVTFPHEHGPGRAWFATREEADTVALEHGGAVVENPPREIVDAPVYDR